MKTKYLLVTLIVIILLIPGTSPTTSTQSNNKSIESNFKEVLESQPIVADVGGEDPLITNVVRNGGFEEADSNGGPDHWLEVGCGLVVQNGSYQGLVHGGASAGRLLAKGTSQFYGSAQYNDFHSVAPRPYLEQNILADFFYYIESIPNTASGIDASIKLEVRIYNGILTHTINYWLSHRDSLGSGNYTYQANILLNSSTTTWVNFDRNITSDYEEVFGAVASNMYVISTGFTVWSPSGTDTPSDFILDDLTLRNSTGYDFITDGDFEAGPPSGFVDYQCSPSYALLSTDNTEGVRSVNMTANALEDSDESELTLRHSIGYPEGYFVDGQGTGLIDFDWKYTDAPSADIDQFAYFYVHSMNDTQQYHFYWYLGRYLDDASFTNTSDTFYMLADGFGNRATWQHQTINLAGAFAELGVVNVAIDVFEFYIGTGQSAGSFVSLLLDGFSFMDYPAHDPGFEQDWVWNTGQVCTGWEHVGNPHPWQNRTDVAHTGDWAGILDVTSYATSGFHRDTHLQLEKDIYMSFWYRINSVVNSGSMHNYARVDFSFDDNYHLEYYLGGAATPATMNSSLIARYYADDYSMTGTWLNLVRNPWRDMSAVFGESNWNITNIQFYAYAEGAASISIIFDDVNFIRDTHGPNISSVVRTPTIPTYYTPVTITADVTDNMELAEVTLCYNNGSWYVVEMTETAGFEATIPIAPYGTLVEYYVNATDYGGTETIGSLENYVVADDIDPAISITSPATDDVLNGTVTIQTTASDPAGGSGIAFVEFWRNVSTLLFNDTVAPYKYDWDSRTVVNGTYLLTATVMDYEGNSANDSVTVTTDNDLTAPDWTTVPSNQEITEGNVFSYQVGASDLSGIGGYAVNDTANFAIDSTGLITSLTTLAAGEYGLNVSVWDIYGNERYQILTITVLPVSTSPTTSTTPTSPTTSPPPLDTLQLIAIAGGGIFALIVIVVIMRRRGS